MNKRDVNLLVKAFFHGVRPWESMLGGQKKWGRILLSLLLVYGFVVMAVMMGFTYYNYQIVGMRMGKNNLGLASGCFFSFAVVFFYSLFSINALLYRSKDLSLVMTLGISKEDVVISRFCIAYVSYLPLYALMLVPAFVVRIICLRSTPLLLLSFIPMVLLGSLASVMLSLLIATVVMKFSKGRTKDGTSKIVFTILVVVMALLGARSMNATLEGTMDIQKMSHLLLKFEKYLGLFVYQANMADNLSSFLVVLVGVPVIASLVLRYVSTNFLCNFSYAQNSVPTRHKKRESSYLSIQGALIKREWQIVNSNSVFQMEIFGEVFIPVILIVIYSLTGVISDLGEALAIILDYPKLLEAMFLGFALFEGISMISCTSISRQGKRFALDKVIPLSPLQFIKAKVLFHLCLTFIPNILYLFLASLLLRQSLFNLLWMLPLSFLAFVVESLIGLSIDYHRPNLAWMLPQQAIKSNVNGLLGLLATFVLTALMGVPLLLLPLLAAWPVVFLFLSLLVFGVGKLCLREATWAYRGN